MRILRHVILCSSPWGPACDQLMIPRTENIRDEMPTVRVLPDTLKLRHIGHCPVATTIVDQSFPTLSIVLLYKDRMAKARRGRRAPKKPRVPRPLRLGADVHSISRTYNVGSFVPAAADFGLGFLHTLGQLPSFAEFTTLFDAYKLDCVTLRFVWRPGSASDGFPTLLWCFDPDDGIAPSTESEMMERQGTKYTSFSSSRTMVRHRYKPHASVALLTNGGVQRKGFGGGDVWCDMATTDVGYFGSKVWFAGFNTAITPSASILVYATYDLRLRFAR